MSFSEQIERDYLKNPLFWPERQREAAGRIYRDYGVWTVPKFKPVLKFGRTIANTNGTKNVVALLGSGIAEETLPTTNSIDKISHTSTSDNGKTVDLESHIIDEATGKLSFRVQQVTLGTPAAPASIPIPCARTSRIRKRVGTFASPASKLVGAVYAYESDGVSLSGGVPQTAAAIHCVVAAGKQQSEKCATSFSNDDWYFLDEIVADVPRLQGSAANVDIDIEYRAIGGVFLPVGLETTLKTTTNTTASERFTTPIMIPNNNEVRMVMTADTDNVRVAGHFNGFIMTRNGAI